MTKAQQVAIRDGMVADLALELEIGESLVTDWLVGRQGATALPGRPVGQVRARLEAARRDIEGIGRPDNSPSVRRLGRP